MLLVVDIGNTNIVFAVYDQLSLKHIWRMRTNSEISSDEYAVFLHGCLSHNNIDLSHISHAIVASVVPKVWSSFYRFLQSSPHIAIRVVGEPPLDSFIDIEIDNPKQAGADRLVNAWACYRKYRGDCIIVDFGTATTFDVIDDKGAYHGGAIAPGINMSMRTLHAMTAQLPTIDLVAAPPIIGKSSIQAQQAGIYWGYHGLVTGIIARMRLAWPRPLKTIATGGLADLFANESIFDIKDDNLTIYGLAELANDFA